MWFAIPILTFVATLPAPPEATPQNIRASVQRSLPYIEKVGTDWMRERKCNSCHNVTFMIWSHNEAAAHGLVVDRKKLADWTKWSLNDSLSGEARFKLRPWTTEALKAGGMTDAQITKLKPLTTKSSTEKEYLEAAEKAIGREVLDAHKDLLIKTGTLPHNNADTLYQHLIGRAGLPEDKFTIDSQATVRKALVEWQEVDGRWLGGGQLPGLKWSEKEMHEATTMWTILALSIGDPKDETTIQLRAKALEYIKKTSPGITMQSLALHTVIAHKFGDTARAPSLLKDFLARQNADGGWSWVKENTSSDAFATGQALYALGLMGRDGNDPVVRKAWEFLLRTQYKDGHWEVAQNLVNARNRGLNVYPFWGTSWAAIGMLQTLPGTNGNEKQP